LSRLVAFLRAINVGGHVVKMADLRTLFESLGFSHVTTFIASGNVIFDSKSKSLAALEKRIEARLLESLDYEVATFIRTPAELIAVSRYEPFTAPERESALALNVAFLAEPLTKEAGKTLLGFETDNDRFHSHGREVYWLCQKRQSDSKFTNVRFERALRCRATWRGVRTVSKLAASLAP
jgi:uncharacterized protein (DUF1697 family)